eukprot:TRINITY_DN8190_c0_g1_i1.p1 TRINITY_DN8190_c0_g1~~TRINITY_DN8190_c0_g1_i1.p1  ORF type:complete len:235 (-),score=85.23 TRINITY_DN8190_c0_g1_i1:14-718(-)
MNIAKAVIKPKSRKLIIGVGNFMFPRSRYSAGLYVVDRMMREKRQRWTLAPEIAAYVIESGENIYVKPTTYLLHETGRAVSYASRAYGIPVDNIIVLHYDTDQELGNFEYRMRGGTGYNEALSSIFKYLDSDSFRRVSIGVGVPDNYMYQAEAMRDLKMSSYDVHDYFIANKFLPEEMAALDNMVYPQIKEVFESKGLDQPVSGSKASYRAVTELAKQYLMNDKNNNNKTPIKH